MRVSEAVIWTRVPVALKKSLEENAAKSPFARITRWTLSDEIRMILMKAQGMWEDAAFPPSPSHDRGSRLKH